MSTQPTWIQQDFWRQIQEPLRYAPPGGFPVSETTAPRFQASADVIYQEVLPGGGIMDWLRANQTTVFIGVAGLFVLAIIIGGKRRR